MDFPNLLFDLGQATLQAGSLPQIHEIAATLQTFDRVGILVNGHTDNTPFTGVTDPQENLRRNMRLSADRAVAVQQELTRLGVPAGSIRAHGYGPTRPVVDTDTDPNNRRWKLW